MHFSWLPREHDGLSVLAAKPQDYDGVPPVEGLLLGTSPERVDPNLTAVAATLAFEAYVTDEITLDTAIMPLAADALVDFLRPARVRCLNIDHRARRMAEGQGSLTVVDQTSAPVLDTGDQPQLGSFRLHLVESFETPRGFAYKEDIFLPTNAAVVSPRDMSDTRRIFPKVASALTIAGEFGIREIRLLGTNLDASDPELLRARALLRAVNRELVWS